MWCGPFLEVLQYQANPWSGQRELRHMTALQKEVWSYGKSRGLSRSFLKLRKTDTTFDLSLKSREAMTPSALWRNLSTFPTIRVFKAVWENNGLQHRRCWFTRGARLAQLYSGFSSVLRINFSPFTEDFRGPEPNNESHSLFFTSQVFRPQRQHNK